MNTINNVLNSSALNVQNSNQVSNTQAQTHAHRHHHHNDNSSQDSVQISNESSQISANSSKSPLDSLVANGTITQDQENSIKSAFMAARQSNQAGTYGSTPSSPLSSLVANGTISQSQADSITSAFKSGHQHMHRTENIDAAGSVAQDTDDTDILLNSISDGSDTQAISDGTEETDLLDALNTQL